jgi:hypothetical protein
LSTLHPYGEGLQMDASEHERLGLSWGSSEIRDEASTPSFQIVVKAINNVHRNLPAQSLTAKTSEAEPFSGTWTSLANTATSYYAGVKLSNVSHGGSTEQDNDCDCRSFDCGTPALALNHTR